MDNKKIKRWAVGILIVLALLVAAFSAGRFSAPLKVQEVEKVRVQLKEDRELTAKYEAAISEREVWRQKFEANQKTVKVKIPVPVICDGGAPVIAYREEERTETSTRSEGTGSTETTAKASSEAKEEVHRQEVREVFREKIVTLRPDWRFSGLAGAAIKLPEPGAVLVPPSLTVGLEVDRRIAGGFSLGIWAAAQIAVIQAPKMEVVAVGGRASFEL